MTQDDMFQASHVCMQCGRDGAKIKMVTLGNGLVCKPCVREALAKFAGTSSRFEEFWLSYPRARRQSKQRAVASWARQDLDQVADAIIRHVRARVRGEWKDRDPAYIPMPETFLNQRRWEDEIDQPGSELGGFI